MRPLPEEKLLKLIRGKGRPPAGAADAAAPPRPAASVPSLPWPSTRTRLRYGTRALIIGLGCLLVVEFILLIVQAVQPPPRVAIPPLPEAPDTPAAQTEALPPIPSLAQSASRPLFTASPDVPGAASTGPRPAPSSSAALLASRLTLLGIIAGNPGQAIIEDSQTKKTYFVSPGQAVVGGAVVDQVQDHRVILDVQGEKIDLTL
ncbi:MAG: hypothetical protein HY353_04205 [Candidatus Omnitrophica bacterium]|nr:hypothetical protein [Candidatus Omnitrophota bacterium]